MFRFKYLILFLTVTAYLIYSLTRNDEKTVHYFIKKNNEQRQRILDSQKSVLVLKLYRALGALLYMILSFILILTPLSNTIFFISLAIYFAIYSALPWLLDLFLKRNS